MAHRYKILFLSIFFLFFFFCSQNSQNSLHKNLSVEFSGKPSQIEIGSPYVGIEMHTSSPLLNRISFYYPVANSIDLSTDYWKRDQFRIFFLGLKFGDKPIEWLQPEPIDYELTPYSVVFTKTDDEKTIQISYEFCKNKPAFVTKITITNNSPNQEDIELFTHLETSLRTCHSYKLKDKARFEFDETGSTIYTNFDDPETGNAQIFVTNADEQPQNNSTQSLNYPVTQLPDHPVTQSPDRPVTEFFYSKKIALNQSLDIVQIIGSCKQDEGRDIVSYLLDNYEQETSAYQNYVLNKAYQEGIIKTNDHAIDHSVHWAKAILATNIHYLDGEFLPMPCPAQYNFYFTHDVQLTDLAAVNFDLARVKNDLEFIVKHATENKIIPHAYYWRDDRYVTEYTTPDNWNHFWFILLSASYLRHSSDIPMLEKLYPYIETSLNQVLQNKKEDGLVWAYRPDWWDIGRSYGPRSYMTILTIRAIREFVYVSTVLNKNLCDLKNYEDDAFEMQQKLTDRLWDTDLNYLINYFEDGSKDTHYYIGSLLAAHYNLIDEQKKRALIQTAQQNLLDEKVGIYNVYPMDFHQLIDYLKFAGNEAGDPFFYGNGGIWPHGNAWYALGRISIGEKAEAFKFIKNIMTLEGIMNSPNGQPAMYEYRNSNKNDPSIYGKVDKPQFMWAAGWYLYSLYHLLGLRENEWNIGLDPYLIEGQNSAQFNLFVNGKNLMVTIKGHGDQVKNIKFDGKNYPSLVLPEQLSKVEKIEIELGNPDAPYLFSTNSILASCQYVQKDRRLNLKVKAFAAHENNSTVISPWQPKEIVLNNETIIEKWDTEAKNGVYYIEIQFTHQSLEDVIEIRF
jgi:glycogen debranching enzyme